LSLLPSDGEQGRDQQQGQRREVAHVDAVVVGELEQDVAFGERLGDHDHDGQGDQQQGDEEPPPAGWLLWSRHVFDGTKLGWGRGQAVVNDQVRVLNWTHLAPLVAWTYPETRTLYRVLAARGTVAASMAALVGRFASTDEAATVDLAVR
jgi:hypothetical protein